MFNTTQGPARARLDSDQVRELRGRGALVINEGRTLTQYFDGRFLTARDLTRDQNYFLSRQADLGQAGGGGVVHGLLVAGQPQDTRLTISPGHGITVAGELVLLPEALTINLANIAEIQQLNVQLELSRVPSEPPRTRSGIFIVALRPIEFTDNPIASYPTSLTGPRTVEDSDIVEAVAVTLIPYVDRVGSADLEQRRAAIARELFVERARRGVPENALPLAMIAIERGRLLWVDPYLVRREAGALPTSFFGLGQAPRVLREAHLLQYQRQLRETLIERGANARLTAAETFRALPPAGPLPFGSLNANDFTQTFFPVEVDVRLTVIPIDELGAIVEESLTLPPIDLLANADELEATSVLILLPVERRNWQAIRAALTQIERELRPAVPGLVAMRKPIQALQLLKPIALLPTLDPGAIVDQNWRNALNQVSSVLDGIKVLWYVRRRNVLLGAPQTNLSGPIIIANGNDVRVERELDERIGALKLERAVEGLRRRSTAAANAGIVTLLASAKVSESRLLLASAVEELEQEKTLDQSAVAHVAARFDHPKLGEGLRRLEVALPALKEDSQLVKRLTAAGKAPELDRLARLLPDAELQELAGELAAAAREKTAAKLNRLLERRLKEMPS